MNNPRLSNKQEEEQEEEQEEDKLKGELKVACDHWKYFKFQIHW